MQRALLFFIFSLTLSLLLLFTLSSTPQSLPLIPHADLIFHFFAHLILCLSFLPLSPSTPHEAVYLLSILLALLIEVLQSTFSSSRSFHPPDLLAAALSSAVVFLIPQNGRLSKPSCHALHVWLYGPDEDDDIPDDAHRVDSWAV